jgi:hypothetical protein
MMNTEGSVRYGLCQRAQQLTKGKKIQLYTITGTKFFPDGSARPYHFKKHGHSVRSFDSTKTFGDAKDPFKLYKYILEDGRTVCEEVQKEHINGEAKVYFLALRDSHGNWLKETLWTDEEIDLETRAHA